jgi:hypothetical protein
VVFRRTVHFSFEGVDYRQREQFFCVRSPRFAIDDAGWTDVERRMLLEQRWWTYTDLVATDEIIHPAELAQILRDILAGSGQDASGGTGRGGGGPT